MLSKTGPFFGPIMLHMKTVFCNNILTLYIFEKLMVLTLETVQTDFDPNILVTVAVH